MRIGIDLGGTKIEGIAMDRRGAVRAARRIATPQGDYDATIRAIADLVAGLERDSGASAGSARIGIGMPGSPSPQTGLVRNANSTCLNGKPIEQDLRAALARPLKLENDANCFALSEARDGAAVGAHTVFGVILGTGVGGGIVVGGELLRGRNHIAGDWGHLPLPKPEDDEAPGRCYCGRRGCVETWCSGPAMTRDFVSRTGLQPGPAPTQLIERALDGDRFARQVFERYVDRLARSLSMVVKILDPDVIVLGGGVSRVKTLYQVLPQALVPHVFSDCFDTPILAPRHGDSSGVRGAAWLWGAEETAAYERAQPVQTVTHEPVRMVRRTVETRQEQAPPKAPVAAPVPQRSSVSMQHNQLMRRLTQTRTEPVPPVRPIQPVRLVSATQNGRAGYRFEEREIKPRETSAYADARDEYDALMRTRPAHPGLQESVAAPRPVEPPKPVAIPVRAEPAPQPKPQPQPQPQPQPPRNAHAPFLSVLDRFERREKEQAVLSERRVQSAVRPVPAPLPEPEPAPTPKAPLVQQVKTETGPRWNEWVWKSRIWEDTIWSSPEPMRETVQQMQAEPAVEIAPREAATPGTAREDWADGSLRDQVWSSRVWSERRRELDAYAEQEHRTREAQEELRHQRQLVQERLAQAARREQAERSERFALERERLESLRDRFDTSAQSAEQEDGSVVPIRPGRAW
ncbi:MAG: ROK family protein [Neomegalonema sp.]|nr:ROK family protein [Neomegalonema sp.]